MPLALADVIMVPHDIFRNTMSENLKTLSTPPKAAHAGKKLRYVHPFVTSRETVLEVSSMENGFPETDEAASIARTAAGDLKPKASTAIQEKFYFRLKRQAHVDRLFSLERRDPSRGLGANGYPLKNVHRILCTSHSGMFDSTILLHVGGGKWEVDGRGVNNHAKGIRFAGPHQLSKLTALRDG